jgi:hypothetical protein
VAVGAVAGFAPSAELEVATAGEWAVVVGVSGGELAFEAAVAVAGAVAQVGAVVAVLGGEEPAGTGPVPALGDVAPGAMVSATAGKTVEVAAGLGDGSAGAVPLTTGVAVWPGLEVAVGLGISVGILMIGGAREPAAAAVYGQGLLVFRQLDPGRVVIKPGPHGVQQRGRDARVVRVELHGALSILERNLWIRRGAARLRQVLGVGGRGWRGRFLRRAPAAEKKTPDRVNPIGGCSGCYLEVFWRWTYGV